MSALRLLLPIALVLVACGGSGDADPGDTTDTALSADTGTDPGPAAGSVLFRGWVTDGATDEVVEGGELCVLEPEQDAEPCATSDADGMVEWTWLSPTESNFTAQFTLEGYTTLLYLGHYDDEVATVYSRAMETEGAVSITYRVFTTSVISWWLGKGEITMDDGAGHIFVMVTGATEDTALDGMTASLSDGSGTVVYWGADALTLNPALVASSVAGSVVIGNVAPGNHTVNVAHESLGCDNVRAWLVDAPNAYTVPVQADTVTVIHISCASE
jgi:hypothetical protein